MQKTVLGILAAAAVAAIPAITLAQSKPTAATYITKEEVDKVNATPGVDRTIKVVDIGPEHYSVGIIHRGATPAAGAGGGGRAGGGAAGGGACGTGRGDAVRSADGDGPDFWRRTGNDRPRSSDRRLSHRVRRRHHDHGWSYRERQSVGCRR